MPAINQPATAPNIMWRYSSPSSAEGRIAGRGKVSADIPIMINATDTRIRGASDRFASNAIAASAIAIHAAIRYPQPTNRLYPSDAATTAITAINRTRLNCMTHQRFARLTAASRAASQFRICRSPARSRPLPVRANCFTARLSLPPVRFDGAGVRASDSSVPANHSPKSANHSPVPANRSAARGNHSPARVSPHPHG